MMGALFARSSAPSFGYECCVCLGSLDAPASIVNFAQGNEVPNNQPVNPAVGPARGGYRGRGRGGGRGGGAGRNNNTPPTPTDVVATHCGHLSHQLCLDNWFNVQGNRSCPYCRQNVPLAKQFRLYPSKSGNGGNDGGDCAKPECQQMKMNYRELDQRHNELRREHKTLRAQYIDRGLIEGLWKLQIRSLSDANARKDVDIHRLQLDNERKDAEIQRLQRQIQGHRVGPTAVGRPLRKRRRLD